jgi:hypothetical protein
MAPVILRAGASCQAAWRRQRRQLYGHRSGSAILCLLSRQTLIKSHCAELFSRFPTPLPVLLLPASTRQRSWAGVRGAFLWSCRIFRVVSSQGKWPVAGEYKSKMKKKKKRKVHSPYHH